MTPYGRLVNRPCNEPPYLQCLFQNVVAVALRVIRDVCDDFVAELLVEWLCLEAERRQEDTVASLHSGFVFGRPEELFPIPLSTKRLSNPQGVEVEPASPDVTKGSAEYASRSSFKKMASGL